MRTGNERRVTTQECIYEQTNRPNGQSTKEIVEKTSSKKATNELVE
jgi:hypothetical protein